MDVRDKSDVEEFTKWATSPSAWFSQAEQLRRSSELLWQPIGGLFDTTGNAAGRAKGSKSAQDGLHAPAYLLLAGFSLEAILKATAIQVELNAGGVERVIVSGPSAMLQPWVKTHKLEKLAARAGVVLQGESLLYLRRFERFIMWAGRYPVPLAPPASTDPRGFDYQVGMQDRDRFEELYDLARKTYLAARDAPLAWTEPTSVGDYNQRAAVWAETCTEWLRVIRPRLIEHGLRVARGASGVLVLNIDVSDMRRHLTPPTSLVRLDPGWFGAGEFIEMVRERYGVGAETGLRWADMLSKMDPTQDVALFLYSTPDAGGGWFNRFLVLKAV